MLTNIPVGAWPVIIQVIVGLAFFTVVLAGTRRYSLGFSALFLGAYALALWKPNMFYGSITLAACSVVALLVMSVRGTRKSNESL